MLRFLGVLLLLFIGLAIEAGLDEQRSNRQASQSKSSPARLPVAEKLELNDAQCLQDKKCWYDRHGTDAKAACEKEVEKKPKYEFKWTTAWYEPKFDRGSVNLENGDLYISGDRIEVQNGLGAWQRMGYLCTYSPDKKSASVYIQEGRWPDEPQ